MKPQVLERLFTRVREATTAQAWSSGVSLARDNKVVRDITDHDDLTFRVLAGGRGKSLEVELFPEDLDWQCECGSPTDACEHVAGVVIALRGATQSNTDLPSQRAELLRLSYHLSEDDGLLAIERFTTASDGTTRPYRGLLGSPLSDGTTILQVAGDLDVDLALGTFRHGKIPRADLPRLLTALALCRDRITFDNRPISIDLRPVLPILDVEDAGRGFFARLTTTSDTTRRFRNGAALVDSTLRPIDDHAGLSEGERQQLTRGRGYSLDEAAELAQLIDRAEQLGLTVVSRSRRLPRGDLAPPRLHLLTERADDRLVVLPTLVYGDPPVARVDRGALTLLTTAGPVPIRDLRAEERLAARLYASLGLEIGHRTLFEAQAAVQFANKLHRFQSGIDQHLASLEGDAWEDFTLQAASLRPHLQLTPDGTLDLTFTTEDDAPADPARVLRAWTRGWNVAPIEGGGFAPLPATWLAEFGPILRNLLDHKEAAAPLPTSAVADVTQLANLLQVPVPPRFDALRALLADADALAPPPLPADLTADLRPYQAAGVAWLALHRDAKLGALLADDMGLGKTLQALTAATGRTLVVAPTSVLFNWAREAARFRPGLTSAIYHGPKRTLDPQADLTLTTWAVLRLDQDLLAGTPWDTVILDEAQTIKNPDSQVAKAAHRLRAPFRVCLSGTPVENRLSDLWSQMAFLEPGFLGGRDAFDERYATPIAQGNALAAQELRQRLRPFILRRRKTEVAPDLPPRTELVATCDLTDAERQVYDALRAAAQRDIVEALGRGGNVLQALELLLRLRQAACHRGLIPGQSDATSSSKVELLLELLTELTDEGHKILVFSQWTSLLDRVEPHLAAADIAHLRLDGATTDRQAVVDAFQAPDGPPVLLLSLKAGGTGLTLTAADHVILMDPWWNPAVEDQAADRAHRIGQDKPVFIHRLVAADTVEGRILKLQEEKRKLAEAALGTGDVAAAALTRDDLLELLR